MPGFGGAIPVASAFMLAHKNEQRYLAAFACAVIAMGALLPVTSCGAPGFATAPLARAPETPGDQTRCRLAANQENPLVTEWPATEKANLEARLRQGSVIVSYSGCTLRMLPRCRVRGDYAWRRTTTSTDVIEIRNADELFAKMPLGAVSLEGELPRSGRLAGADDRLGTAAAHGFRSHEHPQEFGVRGGHARGRSAFGRRVQASLRRCCTRRRARGGDGDRRRAGWIGERRNHRPRGGRARALRTIDGVGTARGVRVSAADVSSAATGQRGRPRPTGTVKVKFLPVRADQDWEVMVGDRPLCKTPCERWVDPAIPYTLKYDPGFFQRNQFIEVPDLRAHQASERVEVRAEPRNMGQFVTGIMLTSLGGVAVVAGTALTAIGCTKGTGLCTAGLITLPVGLLAVLPGVWIILDSKGTVRITPMAPQSPHAGL